MSYIPKHFGSSRKSSTTLINQNMRNAFHIMLQKADSSRQLKMTFDGFYLPLSVSHIDSDTCSNWAGIQLQRSSYSSHNDLASQNTPTFFMVKYLANACKIKLEFIKYKSYYILFYKYSSWKELGTFSFEPCIV